MQVQKRHRSLFCWGTMLLFLIAGNAQGQESEISWVTGPATVTLGDDVAEIKLPAGYRFADAEATRTLMQAMGNPPSQQEVGLITPAGEANWFVVFEYAPVGYVKDDDQAEIDADALLKSIREATEQANEERQKLGGGALHVTDWSERPHYDSASHNLVWALEAVDETSQTSVNYNVRLLGRRGYMSITLVTEPNLLAAQKPEVQKLLASFSYQQGSRYAEFVSGDKLAGYGLTALVAGGAGAAAAKLGLFAILGKFFAKAGKLIVVGLIALGALFKRIWASLRGRSTASQTPLP